jgi:succinate dehydrogenase/fumarate reductase flavoprotein subunit
MTILPLPEAGFDASVDVAVVGGGACGMTAALAAADAGAEVMVLERDAKPAGVTAMSQGFICAAGTRAQREAGVEDSAAALLADILAKTRGQTDPGFAAVVARESGPTVDWLTDRGVPLSLETAWRGDFGHTRPRLHGVPGRNGAELLARLAEAAEHAGALISTSAQVSALYADGEGRVAGLRVSRPDGNEEHLGCRAVVLATCGFAASRAMIQRFIVGHSDIPVFTHAGDDGAGIAWGMELGGAVADMAAFQGYGALQAESGILVNYNLVMEGGIQVNREGRRFSNELEDISGQSLKVLAEPGGQAWVVYDERLHRSNQRWHEYGLLQQTGMIREADNVHALAHLTGLPADALAETLDAARRAARGVEHDRFGRDFTACPPLGERLYAVRVTGALFHTQGGLVVDEHAGVCRPDGSRLPNLYAGGGTARSVSGPGVWGYLPAMGLCMAVTLGRLAGQSAARGI